MSKAAQGFTPEAYLKYVEDGNLRRTPIIEKIAIYGWKLTTFLLRTAMFFTISVTLFVLFRSTVFGFIFQILRGFTATLAHFIYLLNISIKPQRSIGNCLFF